MTGPPCEPAPKADVHGCTPTWLPPAHRSVTSASAASRRSCLRKHDASSNHLKMAVTLSGKSFQRRANLSEGRWGAGAAMLGTLAAGSQ